MDEIRKACPFCGASLPEEASFCPCCAQNIRPRRTIKVPTHLRRKVLKLVLGLIVAAAVAAGAYLHLAPATYDGWGEVTYTDDDGTYQLLLSFRNERFTPQPEITEQAEVKGEYRMPSRLFINHVDTGANAAQIFMQGERAPVNVVFHMFCLRIFSQMSFERMVITRKVTASVKFLRFRPVTRSILSRRYMSVLRCM